MPRFTASMGFLPDIRHDGITRLHLSASLNAVPFYKAAGFVALCEEAYAHPSGLMLASVAMEKVLPFS